MVVQCTLYVFILFSISIYLNYYNNDDDNFKSKKKKVNTKLKGMKMQGYTFSGSNNHFLSKGSTLERLCSPMGKFLPLALLATALRMSVKRRSYFGSTALSMEKKITKVVPLSLNGGKMLKCTNHLNKYPYLKVADLS